MNVKRYFAQTAREALRALKEELGADAIVLSNRAVNGGVEILALPADAVGALPSARPAPRTAKPAAKPVAAAKAARAEDEDDYRVSLGAAVARTAPVRPAEPVMRAFNPPRVEHADYPPRSRATAPAPATDPWAEAIAAAQAAGTAAARRPAVTEDAPARSAERERETREQDARVRELQEANTKLMAELTGIRGMIERQLAGFAWGEAKRQAPARAELVGDLLEAGFSAVLARRLVQAVGEEATPAEARKAVSTALNRELRAMSSDADLIDRGGVYALVGPTGVGKTTTTAKLAARCVVRHGADKLALITTDGYRIGAQEQLRIYGRILGVPVFSVRDAADLRQTLAELRNKHMVLIDTVGVSQRDRMVAEQAAMLLGAGNVRRLLLLNATCRGDTLDDVVRAYQGPNLAGCILTKVDEAASLAPCIDVAVRRELELFYVANGQRVPEDLHLPNRAYLLHRALREQAEGSPWKLQGDEAGLQLAAGGAGA
ncbi:flagellar biosynthesis protein FlhF [Pseudothauera rhizosphaerae]|uniref:Flagellar biosynthesis protein FlhF n=1 Tax=Pseudothauera rhizosphaerae TaxID=2565932 RepID=A0A4S4AVZ8_9RHOO|nr:flagellar biosynthesis protein FlhF [Pseudothauera rhizosphaerae]THF64199.1 flagellar biosynthesis protein FlhF [Pseudothauera rhizosphaerae]